MKKKIFAILALVLVLAMETSVVFAVSPESNNIVLPDDDSSSSDDDDDDTGAATDITTDTTVTDTTNATQAEGYLYGDVTVTVTEEQLEAISTATTATLEVSEPVKDTTTGLKTYTVTTTTTTTTDSSDTESQIQSKTVVTVNDAGTAFSVAIENDDETTTTVEFTKEEVSNLIKSLSAPETNDISGSEGTSIGKLTEKEAVEVIAKAVTVAKELEKCGASALSITGAEIQGTVRDDGSIVLSASNVKKGDHVYVVHLVNGVWKTEMAEVTGDGEITLIGLKSLSPFIIIKVDKDVSNLVAASIETDYTEPNETLTNGTTGTLVGATSPKTGDTEPYQILALLALITITGAAVCTRKFAK
jgi:hypothetical protein